MQTKRRIAAGILLLTVVAAGCGGSGGASSKPPNPNAREASPPGDIPDNQAFVAYSPPGADYSVKVPEGWARAASGAATTFTDKLNSVTMEERSAAAPPSEASARSGEVARLARSVKGFRSPAVKTVQRRAGRAVRITYLADSKRNAVTGKVHTDAVERYLFFHNGRDVILTLEAPRGADNVDPWKTVTQSLAYRR